MCSLSKRRLLCQTQVALPLALFACLVCTCVSGWAQAGRLDATFANHGIFKTNFANCCGGVSAVALQSDGKILVGGEVTPSCTVGSILRLNTNGSVDTTFGTNGFVTISGLFPTGPVVLQPDGKILVAGKEDLSGLLARLDSNGQLDSSFGSGGIAVVLEPASQL